ncbi:MAG TPA: 23S rRNA (guanosine(2251)-2'-O)-methyltransferase RlmB [Rhodanobacteraceae bacterium]|nr:23S rRNA (guanosine(2251)-2'-O)-methyltransferase RlmB [Rhodanobacteraceae bacterium]
MSETWIVGINPVSVALQGEPARVHELCIERGSRNRRVAELASRARAAGVTVNECARDRLDQLAGEARHQGVAARYEAAQAHESDLDTLLAAAGDKALLLVLDGVTDPHNLGACLRSAAAAGATAVIVPKDRAAGLSAVARKAAAGGAERVPLVAVTNLARSLRSLRDAGVWLTGLDGDADHSLYDGDFRGACGLVLGGEGAGLRRLTREGCDFLARIPMPGGMESLNVSVAAGVALFEAVRQRGAGA